MIRTAGGSLKHSRERAGALCLIALAATWVWVPGTVDAQVREWVVAYDGEPYDPDAVPGDGHLTHGKGCLAVDGSGTVCRQERLGWRGQGRGE